MKYLLWRREFTVHIMWAERNCNDTLKVWANILLCSLSQINGRYVTLGTLCSFFYSDGCIYRYSLFKDDANDPPSVVMLLDFCKGSVFFLNKISDFSDHLWLFFLNQIVIHDFPGWCSSSFFYDVITQENRSSLK